MAIVLISQTRSLRKALKDLDDIENKWLKEHPKIVSHEDVVRRDDIVRQIREAGFKVHREWDYDNDCQMTTLSWTEYPKDEEMDFRAIEQRVVQQITADPGSSVSGVTQNISIT